MKSPRYAAQNSIATPKAGRIHRYIWNTDIRKLTDMRCYANYLFIAMVIILGTGSMLSACGQKGPLYMPEETRQVEPQQPESEIK